MHSKLERVGEEKATFVQGAAMALATLAFGVAIGITHASNELHPSGCVAPPQTKLCQAALGLSGLAFRLAVVAGLGFLVVFGVAHYLDEGDAE